jgi:RNA polymerase sigma-70 factor (ECF subfamily)
MDKEAFWGFLEPLHQEASAFCHKLTGDREAGEDLYHDTLLRAQRRFHQLKAPSAFRPWLFTIMVNTFRNRRRSYRGHRKVALTDALEVQLVGSDPRAEYESNCRLHAVLSVLSREDRTLVVMHDIEGWTIPELSQVCRKAEGTVKTRLYRARLKMRKAIERCLPRSERQCSTIESDYALQTSQPVDD